ncbi:MAG: hypothetical protein DME23_10870, partial [Verrucomicrobia bacterium]
MKKSYGKLFIWVAFIVLSTSCRSLFSSGSNIVKSPWKTFADAKAAFDQIVPGQTSTNELKALGYNPFTNSNVKILTYLDVMSRFLPNVSIRKEDLPRPV